MRTLPRLMLLLAWLSLLLTPEAVQAQGLARVAGRVLDQSGAALPGVSVSLTFDSEQRTATTGPSGDDAFNGVRPGPAELSFRLINFSVGRRAFTVGDDAASQLDIVLTLALNADVAVTAQSTFRNVADAEDPAANLVGIAASPSQGAITSAQLAGRPVMRPGEVLETIPGMIVSQHSGEGKANQYYVRGFNLDHGTDFSTTVAGVPVNTPTGAHAHGYTDTSFLIPELVSGVQFKKGPYFADEGDFSAAGAANINYVNRLDRPMASIGVGEDRARVVLEAFNLFNARASDIDYDYLSRLSGEPASGVEDVHTHPALPRSFRLGLHLTF